MLHLLVALYVLGSLLGVASAMYVNHYRLVLGFPFFRPFVWFLLSFSLILLVLVSTYYAAANLAQSGPENAPAQILWALANNFIGFAAFSGWLVFFLQTLAGLEGKRLTSRATTLLTIVIAGSCSSYGVGFGLALAGKGDGWLALSRTLFNLAVPVLLVFAMVAVFWKSSRTDFVIPRRSARAFLLLYGGAYLAAVTLPLVFSRSALLVFALVLPATNILPFVWIDRLLLRETGVAPPALTGAMPLDALVSRHGLTGREREIVEHVLRGSSNGEIGDALFISVGTVKNHVYSIYRKVGVRSRGQLHRYVRELSGDTRR